MPRSNFVRRGARLLAAAQESPVCPPKAKASKVVLSAASSDAEILAALRARHITPHALERLTEPDFGRAVHLRRVHLCSSVAHAQAPTLSSKLSAVSTPNVPTASDVIGNASHGLAGSGARGLNGVNGSKINGGSSSTLEKGLSDLPVDGEAFDYSAVYRRNCESVIGYTQVPVGACGPMLLDGSPVVVPMATTEGALVAAVSRGMKALSTPALDAPDADAAADARPAVQVGVRTSVTECGMTRAPLLRFSSPERALAFARWVAAPAGQAVLGAVFNSTSAHAVFRDAKAVATGRYVYLRIAAFSGDAMGMNMLTRGSQAVADFLRNGAPEGGLDGPARRPFRRLPSTDGDVEPIASHGTDAASITTFLSEPATPTPMGGLHSDYTDPNGYLGRIESSYAAAAAATEAMRAMPGGVAAPFPDCELVTLSSNLCTDKKASATNWLLGRGHSVTATAEVPGSVVRGVLRACPHTLVDMSHRKLSMGSALSGTIGGFNAHAANVVGAVFLACGQDLGQVASTSQTLVSFTVRSDGPGPEDDVLVCEVLMPGIEVGTVGGGTGLRSQRAALDMIGCGGATPAHLPPGYHPARLARVLAGSVLAAELNLAASLAANHLLSAHLALNHAPKPAK
eukprot:TRINITY_DN2960_c0_g1_i1.p1 TRINITY_DN2960_c0_g1~~TRINITY_DN2960_c0_g1_i1.p1  ORF type:complete len:628 (+),score=107.97 TRINITY_DN2960_c0_g1_i1:156-2039(+)